jgi:hypothetical protein
MMSRVEQQKRTFPFVGRRRVAFSDPQHLSAAPPGAASAFVSQPRIILRVRLSHNSPKKLTPLRHPWTPPPRLFLTPLTSPPPRLPRPDHLNAKGAYGSLPTNYDLVVKGTALIGTLVGQVVFGLLGDKFGRCGGMLRMLCFRRTSRPQSWRAGGACRRRPLPAPVVLVEVQGRPAENCGPRPAGGTSLTHGTLSVPPTNPQEGALRLDPHHYDRDHRRLRCRHMGHP